MVLGTVAHRAVLWPFVEPLFGTRLDVLSNKTALLRVVHHHVLVLTTALVAASESPSERTRWNQLVALIDRTGGGHSRGWNPLLELSARDLGWVVQRLAPVCEQAAVALAADFSHHRYLSVRSEVSTSDLDWQPNSGSPERLDLIGLMPGGSLQVVELKVSGRSPGSVPEDHDQLHRQVDALHSSPDRCTDQLSAALREVGWIRVLVAGQHTGRIGQRS